MKARLVHHCIHVVDLEASLAFYEKALGIYFITDPDGQLIEITPER